MFIISDGIIVRSWSSRFWSENWIFGGLRKWKSIIKMAVNKYNFVISPLLQGVRKLLTDCREKHVVQK